MATVRVGVTFRDFGARVRNHRGTATTEDVSPQKLDADVVILYFEDHGVGASREASGFFR